MGELADSFIFFTNAFCGPSEIFWKYILNNCCMTELTMICQCRCEGAGRETG